MNSALAEVARCHERLRIDHCIVQMPDGSMVWREIPMEERAGRPDAVAIAKLREQCLKQEIDELVQERDALLKVRDAAIAILTTFERDGDSEDARVEFAKIEALGDAVLALPVEEDEEDAEA